VDPRGKQAVESAIADGLPDADQICVLPDIGSLLDHADQIDALMIGTPCNLHASSAVQVASLKLPVFLEKPVAISWEQLESLSQAFQGREESVVVSFPLRLTDHVQKAAEILRSGRLGTINQVQAINNVSYGGVYFGQWYRDYEKTGGLWLQKATHDLDYINHLVAAASAGARPVSITAMHSRTVYGGTLPERLRCSECDRVVACPESPRNLAVRGNDGGMLNYAVPGVHSDHLCAFSKSIKNQDAGTAMVMYSDGVHAVYSQNFLTRGSAGRRGATITGYHATLQFDWQSDVITVIDHHRENVDRIDVPSQAGHGGGDAALARNFVDVILGRGASLSPLDEGILSAAMCLAAKEAAEFGMTRKVLQYGSRRTDSTNIRPRGAVEPVAIDRPGGPRVAMYTPVTRKTSPDSQKASAGLD
jgi:predicted dehydrogenase